MTDLTANALFQNAKSAALPGIWNQGVKLARNRAVALLSRDDSELLLRVKSAGAAPAASVVLYPEDCEWACDCGGRSDPCEHAVAAVIALHQGALSSPEADRAPAMVYQLSVERQKLEIRRCLRSGGEDQPFAGSLTSLLARGVCPFSPSADDVAVDRLLAAVPRGDFNLGQLTRLFGALERLDVEFEGRRFKASSTPVKPVGRVRDRGEHILLEVVAPPELERVVAPGIAVADGALRPVGVVEVAGLRFEKLPLSRSLRPDQAGELVERILPELSKSIVVDVQSSRLPAQTRTLKPWIHFDLSHQGHTLSVLPTLVYGDPPVARLDGSELTLLGKTSPRRDTNAEHRLLERLRDRLNLAPGRRVHFDGAEAARVAERLRAFSQTGQPAPALLADAPELSARLELRVDGFEVHFTVTGRSGKQATADPDAVLRAWRDGAELVPVSGGGFARIPEAWLTRFGEQLANLLAARQADGSLPRYAVPTLARLAEDLGEPAPAQMEQLAPLFRGFQALPVPRLPDDLKATLRPYQLEAVRWLGFLQGAGLGAVLADDMGLGKTLQTLCAIRGKTLVVCPRSVLFNWEHEIARFRPTLKCHLYHGPNRKLDPDADVTLTSYALLRQDADSLSGVEWRCAVLDEAQAIKNPASQVARAAFRLSAEFKLALSGTPVENRLEELWSIFRFTHPGLLGSRSSFDERFVRPIAAGDAGAAERLRELTKPFLLRRLKHVVAQDLPPRTETILPIELDEAEQRVYDAVLAATRSQVVKDLEQGGSVLGALEALLRLRQAACHSGLVPGQHAEGSSKIEALLDALDDATADGHKALVFSQWTRFLDRLEPHLGAAGIEFLRLDGSTRDRAGVVERFQDNSGPPVLLASLKAGGTGLNLTAADHVFLMDPWYNPAAESQAADRAHRIGQTRPVLVYKLVARGTVEEGILNLQAKKRQLAEGALSGAETATSITRDDLLALLR